MEKKAAERLASLSGKEKKYYDMLMELRAQLMAQFRFHSDEALDTTDEPDSKGVSTHLADYGSDNFRHEMELALMTSEGDAVERIEEAIERLLDGEYGTCLDCGCKIKEARLVAKPHALFCINCKSIREKNGGMRPDWD